MRRLQALNLGQLVVLVVALAAALRMIGSHAVAGRSGGGFFAYPEQVYLSAGDSGWHPVPAVLLWLVLIALWAAGSVWLLGGPVRRDE